MPLGGDSSKALANWVVSEKKEREREYPLPASMTFDPGLMFNQEVTKAISARYKICVRWGRAIVQSSGVGRKTCMKPRPWLEATLEP